MTISVNGCYIPILISVTKLGEFLYFGQLFKTQGNNYFAKITNTF